MPNPEIFVPAKVRRPIWLRIEGIGANAMIVVSVEVDGKWRVIIRERRDGEISHIWEDR